MSYLDDVEERMASAINDLESLRGARTGRERDRLRDKASGVRLALGYLQETRRSDPFGYLDQVLGPVDGRHVLVFRNVEFMEKPEPDETFEVIMEHFVEVARGRGITDGPAAPHVPLVVQLTDDVGSVSLLDDDAMREAGWVRAPDA